MSEEIAHNPLGLYIHWPFCISKCPYCDFNSHVRESIDHSLWQRALLKDLDHMGQQTRGRKLSSVFFGGGTPSLMAPSTVEAILNKLGDYWQIDNPEITLEANPNSVEIEKFKNFRQAGINRVSIGIQSFQQTELKFLGRAHSVSEAHQAIDIAAQIFDRYSFDLIYALPDQTLEDWKQQLREALPRVRDHVSLYQLTIEPGTAFHTAYQRKDFTLPRGELAADLFELTHDLLEKHGIERYEVSNHAKPGMECKHNLIYWNYDDYIGIGPGAHGRITLKDQKYATKCHRAPELWLNHVDQHGHGIQEKTQLARNHQMIESIMMGLRIKEGINLDSFVQKFDAILTDVVTQEKLKALEAEGYIELNNSHLKTTTEGLLRLNSLTAYLTDHLLTLP